MAVYRGNFAFDRFTIVPNSWVRDKRLTMADKGLLSYILSHSPEYPLTVEQIVAESKDGSDAVSTAMKRLEKVGYLRRQRQRDPKTGRLGPYDWYLQEPGDAAGGSQSDNPATGGGQHEQNVSAGRAQSDFPTDGFTSLANPGTKKTTPKNTIKEDQKDSSSPRSSSSSSPRARREDDDETREKKIEVRKRKERAAARRKVIARTGTDAEKADALLDYLIDQYAAGNLDRYVNGLNDEDLADRLDEATWAIEAERETDAQRVEWAQGIARQIAEQRPGADPQVIAEIEAAYLAALRSGYDEETILGEINRVHHASRKVTRAYVDAIEALGQPSAA